MGHAKVHDQSHWFHWYDPLPHVAVRSNSSSIEFPYWDICYRPRNLTLCPRLVVERVFSVVLGIIPVIVDVRQAGQGLLERGSLVRVQKGDPIIIDFNEICLGQYNRCRE